MRMYENAFKYKANMYLLRTKKMVGTKRTAVDRTRKGFRPNLSDKVPMIVLDMKQRMPWKGKKANKKMLHWS